MSIIVQKFGGTSVADSEKILAAARKAIRAHKDGNQVVMHMHLHLIGGQRMKYPMG